MQTTVMFKTEKKLKEAAQKTAKRLGIPFSAVLNESMREFVQRQQITFKTFEEVEDEIWLKRALRAEKTATYMGAKESDAFLKKMIRNAQSTSR